MFILDICNNTYLLKIINLLKAFLRLIQILIPIGLILLGTIDLGKAVIANDEESIKKNQLVLLRRCIAAVLVFLVATIVNFVMSFVGNTEWRDCWSISDNVQQADQTSAIM